MRCRERHSAACMILTRVMLLLLLRRCSGQDRDASCLRCSLLLQQRANLVTHPLLRKSQAHACAFCRRSPMYTALQARKQRKVHRQFTPELLNNRSSCNSNHVLSLPCIHSIRTDLQSSWKIARAIDRLDCSARAAELELEDPELSFARTGEGPRCSSTADDAALRRDAGVMQGLRERAAERRRGGQRRTRERRSRRYCIADGCCSRTLYSIG